MTPVRVAALQLCSSNHWPGNRDAVASGLAEAEAAGVRLVILPENVAAFGPDAVGTVSRQADEIIAWFASAAARHRLWLLAGTLPLPFRPDGVPVPGGRVRSAALLFDDRGQLRGRYDKRHLFDVEVADAQGRYQESATFEPGAELPLFETPWGGLGVLTCYDLRFPEQARALAAQGADLLVVPAAFTAVTGEAHWQVLLRARAIENQCLVIGAGQGGWHSPQRQTWGHSQVIDAWGRVLAERQQDGAGLVWADWDRAEQAAMRLRMPVARHRRDLPPA